MHNGHQPGSPTAPGAGHGHMSRHQGRGDHRRLKKRAKHHCFEIQIRSGAVRCHGHRGDLNLKTPSPPEGRAGVGSVGMTHDVMCDHVTRGSLDNDQL